MVALSWCWVYSLGIGTCLPGEVLHLCHWVEPFDNCLWENQVGSLVAFQPEEGALLREQGVDLLVGVP